MNHFPAPTVPVPVSVPAPATSADPGLQFTALLEPLRALARDSPLLFLHMLWLDALLCGWLARLARRRQQRGQPHAALLRTAALAGCGYTLALALLLLREVLQ